MNLELFGRLRDRLTAAAANAVGDNIAAIVAANDNIDDIRQVGDNIDVITNNAVNIQRVGDNIDNVNDVASNETEIATVAENIPAITDAAAAVPPLLNGLGQVVVINATGSQEIASSSVAGYQNIIQGSLLPAVPSGITEQLARVSIALSVNITNSSNAPGSIDFRILESTSPILNVVSTAAFSTIP